MSVEKYQQELDSLQASAHLRQKLLQSWQEQADTPAFTPAPRLAIRRRGLAAAFCVLALAVGAYSWVQRSGGAGEFAADNATQQEDTGLPGMKAAPTAGPPPAPFSDGLVPFVRTDSLATLFAANPCGDAALVAHLPLYTALQTTLSDQEMAAEAARAASLFDIGGYQLETADSGVLAVGEASTVEVRQDGTITLLLHSVAQNADDGALAKLDTLPGLAEFIGFAAPVSVDWQQSTPDGIATQRLYYDGTGDMASQLVCYSLSPVRLAYHPDGSLALVQKRSPALGSFLATFPLLGVEEAQTQLLAGNFLSAPENSLPAAQNIAAVDLVYRHKDTLLVPYYRFFLLQAGTGDAATPPSTYSLYFVQAVAEESLP